MYFNCTEKNLENVYNFFILLMLENIISAVMVTKRNILYLLLSLFHNICNFMFLELTVLYNLTYKFMDLQIFIFLLIQRSLFLFINGLPKVLYMHNCPRSKLTTDENSTTFILAALC